MSSKNRQELYDLFATGNKPTQDDFSDLIDSMINIVDDGIGAAEKGEPMEIIQQGTKLRLLDFSSAKESPVWRIGAQSNGVNGLNVAAADDTSRLFIKKENGFIGINNNDPKAKLHITPDFGSALQVDDVDHQTSLVIDSKGSIGIGTDIQNDYHVTIGGKVNLKGETVIDSPVYAANGLSVNGAKVAAQQGMSIQNGATVETGLLEAKEGLTVKGKTLTANAGAIVSGAVLATKNGLTVDNGAVIESGQLIAKAGAVVSGATLEVKNSLTVAGGVIIETGKLEAKAGSVVSGGLLEAKSGLTIGNGAVIENGKLEAKQGLTVNEGAVVETGILAAKQGLTVDKGAVVETGKVEVKQGLTVNEGAVVETGKLEAKQGLTVNEGAVVETGKFEAKQGLTVNEGAVVKTGKLEAKQGLTVDEGVIVASGKLEAKQGLTVSEGVVVESGKLEAMAGLVVQGATTIETGVLTVKGELSVSEEAPLNAKGPVSLGNMADGTVTVNGELQTKHGARINGAELVVGNGISISGNLNAPGNSTLGHVIMTTLTVNDINISGNLGLESVNLTSLTSNSAEISNLTSGNLAVSGEFQSSDNVIFDSGIIYAAYDGPAFFTPILKIEKGTIAGEVGHFEITIDDSKQVTIIYDDESDGINFMEDWEDYQEAQPEKTAGFSFIKTGSSSWDLEEQEIPFVVTGIYREYIVNENGLRIIYTSPSEGTPRFEIKAKDDPESDGFEFTIDGEFLTINYPENQELRTVNQLLSDWQTWISSNLERAGDFEIRKTADSTGELLVSNVSNTDLIVNLAGNIFHKVILKTNTVMINGNLKFGNSNVTIGSLSNREDLSENSDTLLVTQKAIKSYVDNGLALKADQATMTAELATKADQTTMNTELTKKADETAVTEALALKADQATVAAELATKADQAVMDTELAKKADETAVTEALALKADQAIVAAELATKADQAVMDTELAKKADQTTILTELAAKADLLKPNDLTVEKGNTGVISDLNLTADSRGILMVRITTGNTGKAGLFAIHGTDSIIKIAGDGMSDQQDNTDSCNIYFTAGVLTLQNASADDIGARVTYFGS